MRLIALFLLFTATMQAQWAMEESHTTASLRGVDNAGGGAVWVSGTNGTVLRSEDGGFLWQICNMPPGAEKLDFRGIQGFDENTAIVMSSGKGDLSRIYKTTDGCQTWKLMFTNPDKDGFWDAIRFQDKDLGYLLGDPVNNSFVIMQTINGGRTWQRQTLHTTGDLSKEAVFAASNSSLLISTHRDGLFCTGGADGPRLIPLKANATSEERLSTSSSLPSSGCFSVAMDQKKDTLVAAGGDYRRPDDRADTAWTKIAGHVQPAQTTPHGYRSAVAYDAGLKAWITVGPNGTDVSFDDGRNWRALTPSKQDDPGADKGWNALSLPFVVGSNGRIGRLNDNAIIGLRGR